MRSYISLSAFTENEKNMGVTVKPSLEGCGLEWSYWSCHKEKQDCVASSCLPITCLLLPLHQFHCAIRGSSGPARSIGNFPQTSFQLM